MTERIRLEVAFTGVPLLSRLTSEQRSRLARLACTRTYRPGAVIVRQGDTSMSAYVVLSGRVIFEQEVGQSAMTIREMGPGGFFGEMGLIDDLPRSATVIAAEQTECALLAKWDFRNSLRDDPDIALALLPVLTERIRQLEAQRSPVAGALPA
jgi:CRP/FNR family transcriptional regulator, cyclic AMP receptor protein